MAMIKTAAQLAKACLDAAVNHKTLYVLGCFGAPMNSGNKTRYSSNLSYNRQTERMVRIKGASSDTFGFDCVCLIKGLLWGWDGSKNKTYGGAVYASNEVPDIDANQMIRVCRDVSTDFSCIQTGEAVWMQDHIGVYVGGGLAVECTPRWEDGVQVTAVWNIGEKKGYNGRMWVKHGKLPYVTYPEDERQEVPETGYTLLRFIKDVQHATGAVVDGVAGKQTIGCTVTLAAWKNPKHPAILPVQKRLAALGYEQVGTADGVAGPLFTAAVKAFQKDHDCVVDGELTAGCKTWRKLLGME